MTTLADGANITLTLSDYDSVTVTTRGVVTVEAVSGLGVTAGKIAEVTGTRTFGQYSVAGSLKLTASGGSVEYEVADGATPGTPAVFARDSSGNVTGLVGPGGVVRKFYTPPVSQYDRALIFGGPTRQANAVKGMSRNINDAMYVGAITDAEVYDTEAGALSIVASTKAIAFPWRKMLWDLSAGESLLVQARIKTVGATTSSNVLFGNSDATIEGFGLVLYGPTHATTPGRLAFNFKGTGTAGQSIVVTPAVVAGAAVSAAVLPTDTYHNVTIHVDGATKRLDVWTNGQQGLNNSAQTLNGGSTINPVPRNFGFGYIPADDGFTASTAKATRLQAFRMAVLPAGLQFANPGLLDRQFNVNPLALFSDADYLGSI